MTCQLEVVKLESRTGLSDSEALALAALSKDVSKCPATCVHGDVCGVAM